MTALDTLTEKQRERLTYRVTIIGSIGNLLLLLFKFAAGILGRSAAMIADAVHSFSDFITDVIVIVFVRISSKPIDDSHDYGHGKFETLATLIISLVLMAVGVGIFWNGAVKIWQWTQGVQLEAPGMIALIAAIVSIAVKEGLYHYTMLYARQLDSAIIKANAWHHRSDAFSSIGTTIGIAGAIFFGIRGRVLDPLAAVVVSFFIVKVAWELFVPCIEELLEKSLPADVEKQILEAVTSVPEVSSPHNLRTRRVGNKAAVELHVRMAPDMTVFHSHEITLHLEQLIRDILGPHTFVSIHVEPLK